MGRSAGHLALGIGEAIHAPMTIIPEHLGDDGHRGMDGHHPR